MDTAQPSPGAEWGLPVIAHSPGHKQQAVACVIQPGEANLPACLPGDAGGREGKGPSGQRQVCQQGQKSCSPPFPALKANGPASPDLGVWSQLDTLTEAHGGWILCDLGNWSTSYFGVNWRCGSVMNVRLAGGLEFCKPVTTALGKLRQQGNKFKTSLSYRV